MQQWTDYRYFLKGQHATFPGMLLLRVFSLSLAVTFGRTSLGQLTVLLGYTSDCGNKVRITKIIRRFSQKMITLKTGFDLMCISRFGLSLNLLMLFFTHLCCASGSIRATYSCLVCHLYKYHQLCCMVNNSMRIFTTVGCGVKNTDLWLEFPGLNFSPLLTHQCGIVKAN